MLLPSDVARLVLGYLQEEGLTSTSQTFIHESPSLREYAEHSTEDGVIPACVFSLFGKNLTTILNEYVAAKAKETRQEVPVMMTSLWKKLDFTLNQIKCLQNSPAIAANQRMRSRYGVANIRRQRALTQSPADGVLYSSVPETGSVISPIQTCHSVPSHSTPISYTQQTRPSVSGTHLQIQEDGRLVSMPRDSPVQILVPDHRLMPGPMSPGRRKWDTPRRMRGGGLSGSSGTGRSSMSVSSLAAEPQTEEVVDENFPQLVIQNAREKILGDRSLQEKLAENINKILASDPNPQTPKASCSTMEPDHSIDEILGLQGEIHMSDDAIHDILEQTESDPAFQALFELFDYSKTRTTETEQGDGDVSSRPEESDATGPPSADGPPQSGHQGTAREDVTTAPAATPITMRTRPGQDPKTKTTRKSAAPCSLKTTILNFSGRDSRLENSKVRLLVSQDKQPAVSSSAVEHSDRGDEDSVFNSSDTAAPMDVDEPLNAPPPPPPPLPPPPLPPLTTTPQDVFKTARKDSTPTSTALRGTGVVLSTSSSAEPAACETTTASNVNKVQEEKRPQEAGEKTNTQVLESKAESTAALTPPLSSPPALTIVTSVTDELNKTPPQTAKLPYGTVAAPNSGGNPQPQSVVAPSEMSPKLASSTPAAAPVPFTTTPDAPTLLPSTPDNEVVDPSKIVSLEIIISDEQDEVSSGDSALSQAVSSISGDRIPTIFLSSPAKLPAKAFVGVPGTPTANQDETTQAVNSLQSSGVLQPATSEANPLSGKPGLVAASALAGTPQAQSSYIIQLPFDATNPRATTSYILVTDPTATDPQAKQVLVPIGSPQGQPLPASPYALATPPRSQTYPTGSTFILRSPVQPMVLPVSVMGQNSAGKIQMVSNKFVTIPSPVARQQPETMKPQSSTVAFRQPTVPTIAGVAVQKVVRKVVTSPSAEKPGQQKEPTGTGPSYRRVLSFNSGEPTTSICKTTTPTTPPVTSTPVSSPVQQKEKDKPKSAPRTRPAILCAKTPKRRIETVSCTDKTLTELELTKQTEKSSSLQQQRKESGRKTPRKPDHKSNDQRLQSESVNRVDASQPESSKKTESGAKATDGKQNNSHHDDDGAKSKDPHSSRSSSSDHKLKSRSKKEREDTSSKEPPEEASKKEREDTSRKEPPEKASKKEKEDTSRKELSEKASKKDKEDTSRKEPPEEASKKERGDTSRKEPPEKASKKEKEDTSRKEPPEKAPAKSREGKTEKKTASSDGLPHVTANKENEVEGSRQEQQQQLTPSSAPNELSPPAVTSPTPAPQNKSGKAPSKTPSKTGSKTSSLTKQAAVMFQDIHGLNPPSTPVKRSGVGSPDLPIPRTPRPGRIQEESIDCPRTPVRQRQGRDGGEGTPRHLVPPATPELPTCSPASEAGSENSINMAAHTLMILSRAAIARTGSPLKDSLRQEEAGEKSPTASKYAKKRKQPAAPDSPPAKKELKRSSSSSSKKKEKKQKKLMDSFPDDLDVDKFLSSLHYDE